MDAKAKVSWTRKGPIRIVASAALISVLLSGCSAVPDAVNPVKWYEKTTDFFSGDRQASDMQAEPAPGQDVASNQGLAADPNAPPPAVAREAVSKAPSGLSSDIASSNYASPPISRQGAPRDVFTSEQTAALNTPPPPVAQPTVAVTAVPAPAPTQAPAPLQIAKAPEVAPAFAARTAQAPTSAPKRLSFADAPPPPNFNLPASNVNSALRADQFETVVISGDGMEDMTSTQPRRFGSSSAQSNVAQTFTSAARFPSPGATTTSSAVANYGNMTRVATIHFANNSSNMDERDRSILSAVIQLQKERGGRVVVIGHASARTKDMDYIRHKMVNFQISMQRAMTIGVALKARGLGEEQLEVQAVSDSQPQYLEVMPSGEVGNRRVEIYLAAI